MAHGFRISRKTAAGLILALLVAISGVALSAKNVKAEEHYFQQGNGWTLTYDGILTITDSAAFDEMLNVSKDFPKEIIIESGIEEIRQDVFAGCSRLETVTLSSDVKSIGANAFYHCEKLTSINLEGIEYFGANSLAMCGITSLTLGDEVRVDPHAFEGCTSLTSVDLGGLETLQSRTFGYCISLKTIDLSGVTMVNDSVFRNCTSLETVVLGNQTTSVGYNAFYGCTELSSINLDKLTVIDGGAFAGCTGLTSVNIPLVWSIGQEAFAGCSNLETVTFGRNVTVSKKAFKDCTKLATINTEKMDSVNEGVFTSCTSLQSVVLGSDIKTVGVEAFSQCSALTSINLENTKVIEERAFSGCSSLDNIDLSNCTMIKNEAFKDCEGLTAVDLSSIESNLNSSAFSGCTGLTSVVFPDEPLAVNDYAFDGCTSLSSANFENITYIGAYAFRNTGFTSLDVRYVSYFSIGAFSNCTSLTDLIFGYKLSGYNKTGDDMDSFDFDNITGLFFLGTKRLYDTFDFETDFPNAEITTGGAYDVNIDYGKYQNISVLEEGSLVPNLDEPSIDDFIFTGWYADKACTVPFDFSVPVTRDTAIYSGWLKDLSNDVFKGYTLSLEGDIGINYYTIIPEEADPERDYIKFIPDDGSGEKIVYLKDAETVTYNGTTYSVFKCRVPAKKMTMVTIARLYINGNRVADDWFYISDYAYYILDNSDIYKKEAPLVRAMLHYGAYAQKYFNYNTDNLADDNMINDYDYSIDDVDFTRTYDSSMSNLPDGLEFSSASLTLETNTTLNLYFTDNTGKKITFKLVDGDKETVLKPSGSGNRKQIKIKNIPADRLNDDFTVKIIVTGDSTEYSVTYSPMMYAYNVFSREVTETRTPALKDLIKAIYLYNEAAVAYKNS